MWNSNVTSTTSSISEQPSAPEGRQRYPGSKTNLSTAPHTLRFSDQEQVGDRMDATFRGNILGMKTNSCGGAEVNRIDFKHTNNSPFGGLSSVNPFSFFSGSFSLSPNPTGPAFSTVTSQYVVFRRIGCLSRSVVDRGAPRSTSIVAPDHWSRRTAEKDFHALSWRVGTVYNPFPNFAIYGQYATAVDPVGNLITLATTQKDFVLSSGKQTEVGVKHAFWNGRGEWTLAGYEIVKNNLLARDPNNPAVTVQIGQQSSRGIEATMGMVLDYGWRIDANTALLHAQFDDFVQSVGGKAVNFAAMYPTTCHSKISNVWLTRHSRAAGRSTASAVVGGLVDNANTLKRSMSSSTWRCNGSPSEHDHDGTRL
jgi:iron complex outermembrane receptor protein